MKIITKEYVKELINAQIEESKKMIDNNKDSLSNQELKDMVEDDFLSSNDIASDISAQIGDGEATLSDELDLVLIEHMRADACADLVSTIESLESFSIYFQRAGDKNWMVKSSFRDKQAALDELVRVAECDRDKAEERCDEDMLENINRARELENYSYDQGHWRVAASDESSLANSEMVEFSKLWK